ncbi:MAG: transferase [Hyphomicrobium sp.]
MFQIVRRTNSHESTDESAQQTSGQFALMNCRANPELLSASIALEDEAWDRVAYLDHTKSHHTFYHRMDSEFAEYRLSLFDTVTGEVVATGVCLPINLPALEELPEEGWDWAVKTAFSQIGCRTTSMVALSVSVSPRHRKLGLARDVINAIRQLARMHECVELVVPVRPTSKSRHQETSMNEYLRWRDDRGRVFDPWLRSHLSVGGQMLSICHHSMLVVQPLEFWREWVREDFVRSGKYNLDGGLTQLDVDVAANVGRYAEPNIWVRHQI